MIASLYSHILMGCMVVLALMILIALIRSVKGPRVADRIIAVNMLGTMTIVLIAILTIYLGEDYLADICLIYSMLSFLAVVVLTKVYTGSYLQKKGIREEQAAIEDNLTHQKETTEEK